MPRKYFETIRSHLVVDQLPPAGKTDSPVIIVQPDGSRVWVRDHEKVELDGGKLVVRLDPEYRPPPPPPPPHVEQELVDRVR